MQYRANTFQGMNTARLSVVAGVLCLSACSHIPNAGHISAAALTAATDPFTWVPVAGAAVLLAIDEDSLADSATHNTAVFGSGKRADQASHDLNIALNVAAIASSVLVAGHGSAAGGGGGTEKNMGSNAGQHVINDGLALVAASGATFAVKQAVDRERPDHSDHHSFPSGHTAQAFAAARVLSDNLHGYQLSASSMRWLDAGVYTAATATGVGRIEAGEHHPTDVFIGAALGNFMVVWVSEALHLHQQQEPAVQASMKVDTATGVPVVNVAWHF